MFQSKFRVATKPNIETDWRKDRKFVILPLMLPKLQSDTWVCLQMDIAAFPSLRPLWCGKLCQWWALNSCGKWWWALMNYEIVRYSFWQTQVQENEGALENINPAWGIFSDNMGRFSDFKSLFYYPFQHLVSPMTFFWSTKWCQEKRLDLGWSRSQLDCSCCLQEEKRGVYVCTTSKWAVAL